MPIVAGSVAAEAQSCDLSFAARAEKLVFFSSSSSPDQGHRIVGPAKRCCRGCLFVVMWNLNSATLEMRSHVAQACRLLKSDRGDVGALLEGQCVVTVGKDGAGVLKYASNFSSHKCSPPVIGCLLREAFDNFCITCLPTKLVINLARYTLNNVPDTGTDVHINISHCSDRPTPVMLRWSEYRRPSLISKPIAAMISPTAPTSFGHETPQRRFLCGLPQIPCDQCILQSV